MKLNLFLLVIEIGILTLSLASSALCQPKNKVEPKKPIEVEMSVKIIGGKPTGTEPGIINGKPAKLWDAPLFASMIPPDIVVCISEGNSAPKCTSECSDSYSCVFTKFTVTSKTFKVRVTDIDLSEHDLIGEGTCVIDTTCNVGQAQVTIKQICKYGESVDRSKITEDIVVDNPNENINYILIRPDGFEIDLTYKGIMLGDKREGAKQLSKQVMSFVEAKMKACFGIDEDKLTSEINLHAGVYKASWMNGTKNPVNTRANPVNVEWIDVDFDER